ncbi:MAG: DNA primase [Candidatus Nealsonbacteria bacterium]|nr:MAG: DNA primase [Candidatus Nealsonbacteria bacterium]
MSNLPIQEIKDRLDIVEVVGSYIKLQKTGQNYRALCPFHSEKKPSFFVSPARQIFKCFGCGASGDIFKFIMLIEGVEFGDALRILARRAGVELKPYRPELKTKRSRMYEICELSCRFFEKQLEESSVGKRAKEYLLKRGVTEESIKKWRLGYAPNTWQGLSDFLVGKGYKRGEVVEAGLAIESEKSQMPYDRFRGRIIFPIFDLNSQVVGFAGRVFEKVQNEEEIAKYINIPNTLLYDKSRVLYGLNFAKMKIREKDACILTEGYMDVILAHQAGFENTVATSGTALTPYQLKILKRYTNNLLTAFDMDVAGDMATKRGIDLAQKEDFNVKVITMPKESDPADIIAQNPKTWASLINKAKEIMNFYFESALSAFDKESPEGKKEIAKLLLPKIKVISNKILQSHWIQKLAEALKVSQEAIAEELKKIIPKSEEISPEPQVSPPAPKTRKEILEEKVVSLIFNSPQCLNYLEKEDLEVFSPQIKTILTCFKKEMPTNSQAIDKLIKKLEKESEEMKNLLLTLSLRAEIEKEPEPEKEMRICLKSLKEIATQNALNQLSKEIQIAEVAGDEKKVKNLIQKFNRLAKILTGFQKNAKNKI